MNRLKLAGICVLASTLALSGCVARTYNLTRDRVDQDLSNTSGNRGYLMGKAPEPQERTDTRTVRVFEIELGKNKKTALNCPANTPLASNAYEPTNSFQESLNETPNQNFEKYTVVKNDTLQKISKKFYGTTKRWTKIYAANKDTLHGPDKLYAGQILNIPAAPSKAASEKMAETKENLK